MTRAGAGACWGAALALLALVAPAARADEVQPLRLLLQLDSLSTTQAAPLQDPEGPPDAGVRLRRVRVGDDVTAHDVHLRVLFEGQGDRAAGVPFPGLDGGRLPFGGPVRATEAFVGWAPDRAFELDAGSLRVPFSLSRATDEAYLRLPERPLFADAFTPDYRTGVAAGGDLGEILYQAGFFSADRTIEGHLFDAGFLAAGRIVAEPIGPVGRRPWVRAPDDPWSGWFRFAAGLSALYGTLYTPRTLAIAPDFTAQWRRLVVSAEYFLAMRLQSGVTFRETGVQGAAVEPGLSWLGRQNTILAARGEWLRAGTTNTWGLGAAITGFDAGSRGRVTIGGERRWSSVPPGDSYWLIVRLSVVVE